MITKEFELIKLFLQVKPNVGHSEGASGITSIIKTVLALERRVIPPNIFFKTPNPSSRFCSEFQQHKNC